MRIAYDVPRTPARAAAVAAVAPEKRSEIEILPSSAERVWMWDEDLRRLQVFVKPRSVSAADQKQWDTDRPEADQWQLVVKGSTSGIFIRTFSTKKNVEEITRQVESLEWVTPSS